jgi:hypothetical protein
VAGLGLVQGGPLNLPALRGRERQIRFDRLGNHNDFVTSPEMTDRPDLRFDVPNWEVESVLML